MGQLYVSRLRGDTDGDGDWDNLYAFGGRCLSFWTLEGQPEGNPRPYRLVRKGHTGNAYERMSWELAPERYNQSRFDAPAGSSSTLSGPVLDHVQALDYFDGCIMHSIYRLHLPAPKLYIDLRYLGPYTKLIVHIKYVVLY